MHGSSCSSGSVKTKLLVGLIVAVFVVAVIAHYSLSPSPDQHPEGSPPVQPELTPFETLEEREYELMLASGRIVDCHPPDAAGKDVKLPRIPSKHIFNEVPYRNFVTFNFAGEKRRVDMESYMTDGSAVLTDGKDCAVVEQNTCGSNVRFIKMGRDGKTIFKVNDEGRYHAHQFVCFAPRRGLILIFIMQVPEQYSWIKVWDWNTGKERFIIRIPPMAYNPTMLVTDDERYLVVRGHDQIARRYDLDSLDTKDESGTTQ